MQKKIIISGGKLFEHTKKDTVEVSGEMSVSDGFHTMDELYEHRIELFIALCRMLVEYSGRGRVWCSTKHSDGSSYQDWFLLGIDHDKGLQMTYHLPASYWSRVCEFANVLTVAPEFDGHTPTEVLARVSGLKLKNKA